MNYICAIVYSAKSHFESACGRIIKADTNIYRGFFDEEGIPPNTTIWWIKTTCPQCLALRPSSIREIRMKMGAKE